MQYSSDANQTPAEELGVLIVGLNGAVASTLVAGVSLMRQGLAPRYGMLSETGSILIDGEKVPIKDHLGLDPLERIRFAGWDVSDQNMYDAALRAGVLQPELLGRVSEELSHIRPLPGVCGSDFVKKVNCTHMLETRSLYDAALKVREQIGDLRKKLGTRRLVLVNLASTERRPTDETSRVLHDPDLFVAGLKENHPSISPAMVYFYAAIEEGIPHVNFTPSLAEVPVLRAMAAEKKVLYCGRDGKTGQTLLKTVLAPAFRARQLMVEGWFSTNILGNNDGLVLSDPASLQAKLATKLSVLDDLMGYQIGARYDTPTHVVSIHYYPPRGDAKEAWDNIDLTGFLGMPMQVKVNFLCRDSILAAPLILDLARFSRHAADRGRFGIFKNLSGYFKEPITEPNEKPIHDFAAQQLLLAEYVLGGNRSFRNLPFF
jgi:myo-inositol-1-phosphate synthase